MSWYRSIALASFGAVAFAGIVSAAEDGRPSMQLTDDQMDRVVAGFEINFSGVQRLSIGGAFGPNILGGLFGGGGDGDTGGDSGGDTGGGSNGDTGGDTGGSTNPPNILSRSDSSGFSDAFDGGPGRIVFGPTSSSASVVIPE